MVPDGVGWTEKIGIKWEGQTMDGAGPGRRCDRHSRAAGQLRSTAADTRETGTAVSGA